MRSLMTTTGMLAAMLITCHPAACTAQVSESGRVIRKSGVEPGQEPESRQSRANQARRRIVSRMREGSTAPGSGGVWTREFPDAAPYPVTVESSGNSFSASSAIDGVLRVATTQPMYTSSQCEVAWSYQPADNGVDLTYTISNPTLSMQAMPALQIGGLDLGDVIEYLDHRVGCEWTTLDASGGQSVWSPTAPYPQSLYSPVIIARNSETAVGLSLGYPLFQYKHQIRTYIGRGTGRNGGTWTAKFYLDGDLAPAESREYVVNLRYTKHDDWIHTIDPYKETFAQLGSVRYQQDLRPVWGMAVSDTLLINGNNQRGFRGTRSDLNGWENDVNYILDWVVPAGFDRVMVWGAAGMYDQARQNNYPPQFMADWTGPMVNTESQWTRIRDAGVDLLFWWGRSGQYADRWNDDTLEKFTPSDVSQTRMMIDQYRMALRRGANGIGLDAFTQMDGWHALPWIATLRELKPDATIVAEPAGFDRLHLHVPTLLYSDDLDHGPHYLADYLVPGREMWVYVRGEGQTLERVEGYINNGMTVLLRGREITANDLEAAVERAQQGGNNGQR